MVVIKWHGHACFEVVSSKGTVIVIDPHDGYSLGLKPPKVQADIVLITHEHFDHNAYGVVAKPSAKVISTFVGEKVIDDVIVKGVEAYHDREKGRRRGKISIYKIVVDGVSLTHLGDLGHELDASYKNAVGDIDVLMIPVGGTYTIDSKAAWNVINVLTPKAVIPMHYWVKGLNLPLKPVEDFLAIKPSNWNVIKIDSNQIVLEKSNIKSNTIYVLTPPD
ncbi:MBL fold metallo-hydrolase [Ignisphaera sp. 4213-co]|uniref:MBL fold metallo-hydrolase n=1 Tax=Ignisphaera cupida TaxID=3050454 RepID=A0ABD4Z3W7_9CREN|nr:MBL fold metallo-hydrolase [Ignisphaera sp. 4213-co]MDK6028016.1 MBL fold metallo-hydrolase [Ignisphaera sp. 4213-co]